MGGNMRLRNKKTGEIVDLSVGHITDTHYGEFIQIKPVACLEDKGSYLYDTFAKFSADWEDYEPTEPLIKDEKIRKAVRAWAEANDKRVFEAQVCYQSYGDGSWSLRDTTHEEDCGLAFIGEIPEGLNLGSRYTITELCGEEEE